MTRWHPCVPLLARCLPLHGKHHSLPHPKRLTIPLTLAPSHHQFETPSVNETRKNTTTFSKFRCAHAGDPNIVVSSKRNSTETEIAEKVIEEDEYLQQGICRPNLVGDSSYVYLWQSQYPTVIADADINDSDREDEEWVRIGKAT